MDMGFFPPGRGYWQAVDGDHDELLLTYPEGTVMVPLKRDADYEWRDGAWVYVSQPPLIPDRVSRRQFKMQLAIAGLSTQVEAWVAAQDDLIQIAFNESGEFVRQEPMMQAGFPALNFTSEQVDAFFTAAAAL